MESVGLGATMRDGVDKGIDQVQELDERTRPAVQEQQRRGAFDRRLDMQEMDPLAVDISGELWVRVDALLLGPPVKV